jgi:hypothetical protein
MPDLKGAVVISIIGTNDLPPPVAVRHVSKN